MADLRTLDPLDPKRFWDLVQHTQRPTQDEQLAALVAALAQLPRDDILAFDLRLWHLLGVANRWDLWAAAYLMRGGCSDDGFLYFRCWLVSRGRAVFDAALADPDSLAGPKVDPFDSDFELILTAPARGWEEQTGENRAAYSAHLERVDRSPYPPTAGERFDFDDDREMRRRLPRLARRYLRG